MLQNYCAYKFYFFSFIRIISQEYHTNMVRPNTLTSVPQEVHRNKVFFPIDFEINTWKERLNFFDSYGELF